MVVLTLAANQFGPRLIRNFMTSPPTQVVLLVSVALLVFHLHVLTRSIMPETVIAKVGREVADTPKRWQPEQPHPNIALALDFFTKAHFIHHLGRTSTTRPGHHTRR